MDSEENKDINEPTNFDEANLAAMNMFAADDEQEAPPGALPPEEQPPEQPPTPPVQPQQPPPDAILQRVFGELQALKSENEQLKQAMTQMSEANKENVVKNAMAEQPPLQMPILDLNTLAFDDETTLHEKQGKYAQDMAQYIKASMMKELAPFIEQAKEGIAQKQKNEVITALSNVPDLQDFNAMLPQLDRIIANNKALAAADVPLDEKYITAYLIATGINSRNKPQNDVMTPEKFMQFYQSNPDLRELIDKQRLAEIKGSQDVPPMSPSSGAVNAALNIPKEPTSFDEAYEGIKKFFN